MARTEIGNLSANIAGDERYTDRMTVTYDRETRTATVTVNETTAAGGMDGPGGSSSVTGNAFEESCACPNGAALLALVKKAINVPGFNFKQYGKPTKRFMWRTDHGRKYGLSLALVDAAIRYATED